MELSQIEIKALLSSYFKQVDEEVINIFLSISTYGSAKKRGLILKENRTDKSLIFILKGIARAYITDESGQEINNYIRAQGHLMGDAKAFGDELQTLRVEAISEMHFLKFNIEELETIGYEDARVMRFYTDFLKEIILTLAYRLSTFVSMTPEERYLDLIAWNPILLEKAYDKHLASFLGITPLTIHRIKKKQIGIK